MALTVQRPTPAAADSATSVGTLEVPLFPAISEKSDKWTFRSNDEGLLFQTQFQQPAILLTEKAFYESMKEKHVVSLESFRFAGHSLGEYGVVGCMIPDLDVARLAEVVFLRGLTMQSAVTRDANGRSRFGMVAVSPLRIGFWFVKDEMLCANLIDRIDALTGSLCQIVNYNVRASQYVVAGTLTSLEALRLGLDAIRDGGEALLKSDAGLEKTVTDACTKAIAKTKAAKDGYVPLTRGSASIPLTGIDVPFHSRELKAGVPTFRRVLQRTFGGAIGDNKSDAKTTDAGSAAVPALTIRPSDLEFKYIPNLVGTPFELTLKFVTSVHRASGSPLIADLIANWKSRSGEELPEQSTARASKRAECCRLLVIELLAYQFASPVLWIQTQASLLKSGIKRWMEVGPSSVLLPMFVKGYESTLPLTTGAYQFMFSGRNANEIYLEEEGSKTAAVAVVAAPAPAPVAVAPKPAPVAVAVDTKVDTKPTPAAAAPSGGAVSSIAVPQPTVILHSMRVLAAEKLKIDYTTLLGSDQSVKALAGGKSALQNELLGDFGAEFGSLPDGAEELPLSQLASRIASGGGSGAGYRQHAATKIIGSLSSKNITNCLPGSFGGASAARNYLKSTYGVSDAIADGCFVHAMTCKPAAGRCSTDGDARLWLDRVLDAYASQVVGTPIAKVAAASGGGGAASGGVVAVVDSKQLDAIKVLLRKQEELLREYAKDAFAQAAAAAGDAAPSAASASSSNDSIEPESDASADFKSSVTAEFGSKLIDGVQPMFDAKRIRRYDDGWNIVRQDVMQFFQTVQSRVEAINSADSERRGIKRDELTEELYLIRNRAAAPSVLTLVAAQRTLLRQRLAASGIACPTPPAQYSADWYAAALEEGVKQSIAPNAAAAAAGAISTAARYVEHRTPTFPHTTVSPAGVISLSGGTKRYGTDDTGFARFVEDCYSAIDNGGNANRIKLVPALPPDASAPASAHDYSSHLLATMRSVVKNGLSLAGQTALITGAGPGSIAWEVCRCLLSAGAHVIVTTSNPTRARYDLYRALYRKYAGSGSKLTVVPFNAASVQDVDSLVNSCWTPVEQGGIGIPGGAPNFVLPFAALSENGRTISEVDAVSELAHRAMLTNVVRLLGSLRRRIGFNNLDPVTNIPQAAKTLVILPLSPNHGVFGGDGLYAESKLSLEALFAKWKSEKWGNVFSLLGAEIGWTRGTGLMNTNDLIAESVEKEVGLRTYSVTEMAFVLAGLMHPDMMKLAREQPLKCDISGGFHRVSGEGIPSARLRQELIDRAAINKAIARDAEIDTELQSRSVAVSSAGPAVQPRAQLRLEFPELPKPDTSAAVATSNLLNGMIDLSRVAVVVGFGEVSPWGNARTRWCHELAAEFSMAGAIELARAMGLIRFAGGDIGGAAAPGGESGYVGWLDVKSGQPIADHLIASTYHATFLTHAGIRPVNPAVCHGYDPTKKMLLSAVALQADMPGGGFEVSSAAEMKHLIAKHGRLLEITSDGDRKLARLKRGAVIYVPKQIAFDRQVAGQLPTGWNPTLYGIPKDISSSVDPVTQYALAATVDAFASAGISDPYELYAHVHVSEVGTAVGGGMGGMQALKGIFRDRIMDKSGLSSDQLQESFINTSAAWINMLLVSSCGPIKTPVSACATAAVSVDLGVECIRNGTAKVMVVGGTEDFGEEGSYEFAQMKATSNSIVETEMGREPKEMCRPCTPTRGGFMESQGAGIQILMSAELALKMGVPIYAVVAGTATATDRQGRSVPAPGKGCLSTARELKSAAPNPLLSLSYRRSQFDDAKQRIDGWRQTELARLAAGDSKSSPALTREFIAREYMRRLQSEQMQWGNAPFASTADVAPLRAALNVWNLSIDEIDVVSFHGTGTAKNDSNESAVVQSQLTHLNRTPGCAVPTIFQKWCTGHPKGAAAAWMLNGLIQCLQSGAVPGNRNLDCCDSGLAGNELLLYADRTIQYSGGLRAGYLHSFGFGQAGAQVVLVHPNQLLSHAISAPELESYRATRHGRYQIANQKWLNATLALSGPAPPPSALGFVSFKTRAPYDDAHLSAVLLNPLARAVQHPETGEWKIDPFAVPATATATPIRSLPDVKTEPSPVNIAASATGSKLVVVGLSVTIGDSEDAKAALTRNAAAMLPPSATAAATAAGSSIGGATMRSVFGVGIDMEETRGFAPDAKSDVFWTRNYTAAELAYCRSSANPGSSLAARWCAKEAVIKAISSTAAAVAAAKAGATAAAPVLWTAGAGAPLIDIEIVGPSGGQSAAPTVVLHGDVKRIAESPAVGITGLVLSISHTGTHAIAQVMATAVVRA